MEYRVKTGNTFYICKPQEILVPEFTFATYPFAGKWFVAQVHASIRYPKAKGKKLIAVHETGLCMEVESVESAKKEISYLLRHDKALFLYFTKEVDRLQA